MTQFVLAVVLGALFALGTFLVLRRDVVRVVWGVTIMSQAANVYLVTMGGISPGDVAPIVHGEAHGTTDPLVQALVLTAIVIGFGTTAFALVLTYRVYEEHGTIDLDDVAAASRGGPGTVEGVAPSTAPAPDGGTAGAGEEAVERTGHAGDPPADGGETDG
jgi:multicomponent Na+:H+ antiporter subunit C